MNLINYSIIIPHYNSNRLITRTLKSIPKRSDIQVIVIDDNSSKRSIVDISLSECYSHITFIFSQKSITAGGARNIGIDNAIGKYVIFADSDDYFTTGAFKIFDKTIVSNKEFYQFKAISFFETTNKEGTRHLPYLAVYRKRGLERLLCIESPWAKLVSLDLVKKHRIRFSEVVAGNDVAFSTLVVLHSQNSEFVDETIYRVSQREGSLTTTVNTTSLISRFGEWEKKTNLIKKYSTRYFSFIYLYKYNRIDFAYKMRNDFPSKELTNTINRYFHSFPPVLLLLLKIKQIVKWIIR